MNVIDVGCAQYGGVKSIDRLIEEFRPETLIGLDPGAEDLAYEQNGTSVATVCAAAWTYDGEINYRGPGLGGHVTSDSVPGRARCIDIVPLIEKFAPVVLKLDAEGGEYELLEHIRAHDADLHITLAWVEWHGYDYERRARICDALRCNVGTWRL